MTPSGEWHTYRRDDALSAHCDLRGNIIDPKVQWKLFVGGTRQNVVALPSPHEQDILLCYGGVIIRSDLFGKYKWQTAPHGIQGVTAVVDIDGDGRTEIVACSGYEVLIFSADDGRLLWSHRFAPPESYGIYSSILRVHKFFDDRESHQLLVPAFHTKDIYLFDFVDGAENGKILHKLHMDDAFHPTVFIGDVNNDGNDEIMVSRLGDVAVFDPRTGKMRSRTVWSTGDQRRRTYGLVELCDIDGDGDLECVILAKQVTRHITVLDNDGAGKFSLQWDRFIEHIYPTDTTEVRYVNNSICDIDGDGKYEIAVSIFNEHKDERWRTEIIDARSGNVKSTFEDCYLYDVRDIDGDGKYELFVSVESGRIPGKRSVLKIIRPSGEILWQKDSSAFACKSVPVGSHQGKFRPELFECDEVWADKQGFFVFDGDANLKKIDTRDFSEQQICSTTAETIISAMAEDTLVLSDKVGGITIVDGDNKVHAQWQCGMSLATDGHPVERPSPTPIIFSSSEDRFLAIPDHGNIVSLYKYHGKNEAPELVWQKQGRGRIGFDRTYHSVTVTDMNGKSNILLAVPGKCAALAMYDVDGTKLKEYSFKDFPSIELGVRTGCYDWIAFDSDTEKKLFISFYGSLSMNSESSLCMDTQSGNIEWQRDVIGEGEYGRGFGAWGIASKRGDKEGFFCAKDTFCNVDLRTGELIAKPFLLTDLTREAMKRSGTYKEEDGSVLVTANDPFSAYGSVVLRDVNNDRRDEIFIMGSLGGFGALDADKNVLWWSIAPLDDVMYRLGGIADVDGDGKFEIGIGHSNGDLRCYDALTGKEKWRMTLGFTTIDCATCDIDGDGRAEFICRTTDGRLLAVGVDEQMQPCIKWSMRFDFAVGNPVIADFNGDGLPEIFVVAGDGYLYCIS
jgi:hypothetical protein